MTRRERLVFLLEQYQDVVAGVRDRGTGGEHVPLMCRAWNHPSYQQLEELLPLLARPLYRAIVGTYVYPRWVRRAVCSKCGVVKPPNLIGELHRHPHKKPGTFVARMERQPLYPVAQRDVDGAVAWIDEHWRGGVFVPDELLPLVSAA